MLSQFTTKHSNCRNCWLWPGRSSFPPCPARARQLRSVSICSQLIADTAAAAASHHLLRVSTLRHGICSRPPLTLDLSTQCSMIGNMEILKRKNLKPHFSHCWAQGNVRRLGLGSYYAQSCNHCSGHTIHHHTTCVTWHSLVLIKNTHCALFRYFLFVKQLPSKWRALNV